MASCLLSIRNQVFLFIMVTFASLTLLLISQIVFCCSEQQQVYQRLFLHKNHMSGSCMLPNLDPWDPSIKQYLQPKLDPLKCHRLQEDLTVLNRSGFLVLNRPLAQGLTCQYRCFHRSTSDDDTLEDGEWIGFWDPVEVGCEFIEVWCYHGSLFGKPVAITYKNLHNQIIPRKTNSGHLVNSKAPSVLIFVMDSVSHSNWQRSLPETLEVLKSVYGAYIFNGFNKVADNSLPNAVAFLTGRRIHTAQYKSELEDDMKNKFHDDWPLVWKDFEKDGYATLYAEDMPDYNLFNHLSKGFKDKPTRHYFRPFWLKLYGSFLHRRSSHLCYANEPLHMMQLNYVEQFLEKSAKTGQPYFALSWLTELGHNWLNQVGQGDNDLASFFRRIHPLLKNSFIFVMSDHGHRFDLIRETLIGQLEDRMPFMALSVAEFQNNVVSNREALELNTKRLTSFWDVYVTLREILLMSHRRNIHVGVLNETKSFHRQLNWSQLTGAKRGLSLLRLIPSNRTCSQAAKKILGIPNDYCVCQVEKPISKTDPVVKRGAEFFVSNINGQLTEHTKYCATLELKQIGSAYTLVPPNVSTAEWLTTKMYRLSIETSPGAGKFQALILANVVKNELVFELGGDIDRINRYGNQSHCVSDGVLKKLCYCL